MTSHFLHEITERLRREPFASKEQGLAVEELLDAFEDLQRAYETVRRDTLLEAAEYIRQHT